MSVTNQSKEVAKSVLIRLSQAAGKLSVQATDICSLSELEIRVSSLIVKKLNWVVAEADQQYDCEH